MKKYYLFVLFIILIIPTNALCNEDTYQTRLYTYGGLPIKSISGPEFKILVNEAYAVGYSETLRNPVWVVYRLGNMKADFSVPKWERPWGFQVDERTEARVSHKDYSGTGYDRGHMAPNSAMLGQYGQMAQLETYLMTNICPQTPKLNRGIWQRLESEARVKISQVDDKNKEVHGLYIITGPIFNDNPETLSSGIPIPTHFYKIFAYQKGYGGTMKSVAFIFSQNPETNELMDYLTTVDEA